MLGDAVRVGERVAAVHERAKAAVEHIRSGKGPYILEALTYRYRGHSMSDPAKYRSKEEVQKMREQHDPIEGLKNRLIADDIMGEADLKKIDKEIRDIVNEAARFSQDSPEPDPAELYTDVLADA